MAIDQLTTLFFDLFTNKNDRKPKVKDIKKIFINEGIIINNTTGQPLIYSLQDFITPREKMLIDGTLTDFAENEIVNKTDIFENIAQRFCTYQKSGKLNGKYFRAEGTKIIQFIKIDTEWKMASIVWSDK